MRYVVIAMLITLACSDFSTAQEPISRQETLKGLKGVEVVIEDTNKDAAADGLSRDAIRTSVELILRSSGIPVLTRSESNEMPSSPYLYVNIGTKKSSLGFYAFDAAVELRQRVLLIHQPQQLTFATTYQTPRVTGAVGAAHLRDVTAYIEEQVKQFANDFLTVNPR